LPPDGAIDGGRAVAILLEKGSSYAQCNFREVKLAVRMRRMIRKKRKQNIATCSHTHSLDPASPQCYLRKMGAAERCMPRSEPHGNEIHIQGLWIANESSDLN